MADIPPLPDNSIWQPTCELRFVERGEIRNDKARFVRVLQQKWERVVPAFDQNGYRHFYLEHALQPLETEWRDVPLEEG